jgi:hypothetical protein
VRTQKQLVYKQLICIVAKIYCRIERKERETERSRPVFEAASYYPFDDSSTWDSWNTGNSDSSYYFELYGETQPFLCTNFTETLQDHSLDNDPRMKAQPPIYEYFWTIGISDHLLNQFSHNDTDKLWHHSAGAKVSVYFPLKHGWRVEEVLASVKYVRPLPHQDDLVKKVTEYWNIVAPGVGKAAEFIEHLDIPGVSMGATLIDTLAKAPITSLPPVEGLEWQVRKTTNFVGGEIMEGVRWTLPRKLFSVLGNWLTGSLAVYFHPYYEQKQQKKVFDQPQAGPILAQAEVYNPGQQIPPSKEEKSISLNITPRLIAERAKK